MTSEPVVTVEIDSDGVELVVTVSGPSNATFGKRLRISDLTRPQHCSVRIQVGPDGNLRAVPPVELRT